MQITHATLLSMLAMVWTLSAHAGVGDDLPALPSPTVKKPHTPKPQQRREPVSRPAPVVIPPAVRPAAPAPTESTSSLGISMVRIPSGSFTMGCQSGRDTDCDGDESPAHNVNISAFQIGKYEVTVGQFRRFVEASDYQTTAEKQGSCYSWTGSTWEDVKGNSWRKTGFSQTDNDPVACVSWEDSQAMIAWLNQTAGSGYRLPSESEWEYACRAGGSHNYCGGDNVDVLAWYGRKDGDKTHPVGGKQANAWGLYDMSGNVWEWVQDGNHSDYNGAPTDGKAWQGDAPVGRVLRGGSWFYVARYTRAANRNYLTPTDRYILVGFRLARTPQ